MFAEADVENSIAAVALSCEPVRASLGAGADTPRAAYTALSSTCVCVCV